MVYRQRRQSDKRVESRFKPYRRRPNHSYSLAMCLVFGAVADCHGPVLENRDIRHLYSGGDQPEEHTRQVGRNHRPALSRASKLELVSPETLSRKQLPCFRYKALTCPASWAQSFNRFQAATSGTWMGELLGRLTARSLGGTSKAASARLTNKHCRITGDWQGQQPHEHPREERQLSPLVPQLSILAI